VVERLQEFDDVLARAERNRAFGQSLDLEDLGPTTSGIDVIDVTNEIACSRELDENSGSVRARAINLD